VPETQDTTYEEARRCPKCGNPGEVDSIKDGPRNLPRGTKIHTVYCRNQVCPWLDTCWLVQVNSDGTVPPPSNHKGERKLYEHFEDHDQMARDIMSALQAQQDATTKPGAEVRNPFSR
jgi:hypothetical protein